MKHFLTLSDYTVDELSELLEWTALIKAGFHGPGLSRPLLGKVVGLIFDKPSTRTRVSFEVGVRQLGGDSLYLNARDIQLGRGEPIQDTARVLSRYLDAIVIRTFGHDIVTTFAQWAGIPVINGLTDLSHPCQVLGDLFTVMERGLDVHTMKAAWVGDGNNVANSWIEAAEAFGFELVLACPEGYDPAIKPRRDNVRVVRDPVDAVKNADVISTDVWASMGQEQEIEERRGVFARYTLDMELLSHAAPEACVLHCLPAHRGEEITDEVLESERSLVWDQAENRLHVQKAILTSLMRD